jgi:hypothetical protein
VKILILVLILLNVLSYQQSWGESPIYARQTLSSTTALNTDPKRDLIQVSQLNYQIDLEWSFNEILKLNSQSRFKHYEGDHIGPAFLTEAAYDEPTKPWALSKNDSLELRDFNLEYAQENWFITLGKQQVVWGKTDGLKLLDVINPQSFEQFILEDFSESRIPLWMANIEYNFNQAGNIQFLWIPDSTVHALPKDGASYQINSYRFLPALTADLPSEITLSIEEPVYVSDSLENADFGLRWTAFLNGWDISVNYLNHYDDFPLFYIDFNGDRVSVQQAYERTELIGSSISNSFSDLTLRAEVTFTKDQHYQGSDIQENRGVVFADELAMAIGLDWYGLSDTVLSWQVFHRRILDTKSPIAPPEIDTSFTFLARKNLMNETLTAEILLIHNLEDNDGIIRPELKYKQSDNLNTSIGADYFYGEKRGLFGQFDDHSRIILEFEYSV